MNFTEMSDNEILTIVRPLAEHTENAWNEKNYENFCQYLLLEPDHDFTPENFYEQIERNYERLGLHTVKEHIAIHKNPDNAVVMWKLGIENRAEPGVIIYIFTEHENEIVITGCTLHD